MANKPQLFQIVEVITIASAAYTATTSQWIAGFQRFMATHSLWLTEPQNFATPYNPITNFITCFTSTTNTPFLILTTVLTALALATRITQKQRKSRTTHTRI